MTGAKQKGIVGQVLDRYFSNLIFPVVTLVLVLLVGQYLVNGTDHKQRIAVLIPGPVRFFEVQVDAMRAQAAEEDLLLTVFDANWDASRQIAQIETARTGEFDLIAVAAVGTDVVSSAVAKFEQGDIPLITFTNSVGDHPTGAFPGVKTHVGRDETASGRLLGESLVDLGLVSPRVLLIEGAPGTAPQELRSDGFFDVVDAQEGWPAVQRHATVEWDLETIEPVMLSTFASGEFDVVATHWADAAVVVARHLEQLGDTQTLVVSIEFTEDLKTEMARGAVQATTAFSVKEEGSLTVETAARILRGEVVPRFVEVEQWKVAAADVADLETEW